MTFPLSRRHLLEAGAAALAVSGVTLYSTKSEAQASGDYDAVRARWLRMQTAYGTGYASGSAPFVTWINGLDAEAKIWIDSYSTADLWTDGELSTDYGQNTRIFVNRLRTMAIAFKTAGSDYAGDTSVSDDVFEALTTISNTRYYDGQTFGTATYSGNQWEWEIGVPQAVLDIVIVLEAEIRQKMTGANLINRLMAAILYHNPDITYYSGFPAGGANLMWNAHIYILTGMIKEDADVLGQGLTQFQIALQEVGNRDGFYADGSFIQHANFSYTGGYGVSFLYRAAGIIYLLDGSPWARSGAGLPDQWANMRKWVKGSYDPLMYKGAMMDMARGREITRYYAQDHAVGHTVIYSVLLLAEIAPSSDATLFKQIAKGWITTDTTRNFLTTYAPLSPVQLDGIRLANALVNGTVVARTSLTNQYHFPRMDRVVHQRPGFALGLAMMSTKVSSFESIGSGNLRGWYTGRGATYFYTSDTRHYQDFYWPTVDAYRIPGTTVDKTKLNDGEGQDQFSTKNLTGGASFGASGVACMEQGTQYLINGDPDPSPATSAKKAWFLFGDYILCAGVGISSNAGTAVETIIENRNLGASGENTVKVNGSDPQLALGNTNYNATDTRGTTTLDTTKTLAPASASGGVWAYLSGFGGYVLTDLPGSASNPPLKGRRETRSGSWFGVNKRNTPTTLSSRRYLALWLDHGTNGAAYPQYAYTVLPNASESVTSAYAAAQAITLLNNSTSVQFARGVFPTSTVHGGVFWTTATVTAGVVTCNRPACVFVRESAGKIEIAVSDPTEGRDTNGSTTSTITVTVALANTGVASQDSAITVNRTATSATLVITTTNTKGLSRRVTLNT